MALEVKINVALATNKESVTITDVGTNWGIGGNPDVGDITKIVAKVYNRDSSTPNYTVEFTAQERADYLTGAGAVLTFTDTRWFGEQYAPDNFYTVQLELNDLYTSDSDYFSMILTLQRLVHKNTTTVAISPSGLAESQSILASNIELDSLQRLDSTTDPDRKFKWELLYDFTYANITRYF